MVMTRLTSPQFIQCWQVLFRRECATDRAKKKETRRGKQVLHESENTQQREQWSGLPMWSVKTSGGEKRVSFCLCQAAPPAESQESHTYTKCHEGWCQRKGWRWSWTLRRVWRTPRASGKSFTCTFVSHADVTSEKLALLQLQQEIMD